MRRAGLRHPRWFPALLAALALLGLAGGCTGDEAQSESLTPPLLDAQGILDATFNGTGYQALNWSVNALGDDRGFGVVEDEDDSLVIAGYQAQPGHLNFAAWRLASNGLPDFSFNGSGMLAPDFPFAAQQQQANGGVVLQPDGQLVLAGDAYSGTDADALVWRVHSSGLGLDTSFNGSGTYVQSGGFGDDGFNDVKLDGAGNVIAAGFTMGASNYDVLVLRLTSNGLADSGFGTTGVVTINNAVGNGEDRAFAIALDTSFTPYRILLAGVTFESARWNAVVWRLMNDGTLDAGFATSGKYVFPSALAGQDQANAITLDKQGRIVVAGSFTNGTNTDYGVFRLSKTGVLDTTFGTTGLYRGNNLATGNGFDDANAVTIDPKGRIVVTGTSLGPAGVNYQATVRLTASGQPDNSFGIAGVVTHSPGLAGFAVGQSVIVDHTGRIVVAGHADLGGGTDMAIWRYK